MAVFNAKTFCPMAMAVLAFSGTERTLAAQPRPHAQPIVVDAQSADVDLATNDVVLHKVKITQGDMSIAAEQGEGKQQKTRYDFDDGQWLFRGSVRITMDHGQLASDDAQIHFVKQALTTAMVSGNPAEFEQLVAKTGKLAKGHADVIDYDAGKGIVHLSKNAWLSDGSTEMHGESLKYNMLTQSIAAEASEQASQRVHIVITPPPKP